jgi:hypothetical protein
VAGVNAVPRNSTLDPAEDRRIDVDWQLPGIRRGRKTYVAGPREWQLIEAHRHDSPHELLCVAGSARVYVADGTRAEVLDLLPGVLVEVPAGLMHKIVVAPGSVVAAFVPATIWVGSHGAAVTVPDDVFTAAVEVETR